MLHSLQRQGELACGAQHTQIPQQSRCVWARRSANVSNLDWHARIGSGSLVLFTDASRLVSSPVAWRCRELSNLLVDDRSIFRKSFSVFTPQGCWPKTRR